MTELHRSSRSVFSFNNPLLWVLLPLAAYALLRVLPMFDPSLANIDPVWQYPANHFTIVSATALIALGVSIIVGFIGLRQRNLQVVFVSLAFISLAGFFSMHGLSTPGFILQPEPPVFALIGVAAQLSVLTMSFWLLISSLPTNNRITTLLSANPTWLLLTYTPLIIIIGILAFSNPGLALLLPVSSEPTKYFVGSATLIMATLAGYRYWQSFRYSHFPFQLAIAYTGGWIAVSQIIITTGAVWNVSWWIYHFLLLFSVIAVVYGLVTQYRRGDSIVRSILGLFSDNPAERLAAGLSPSVRKLIMETEARDPYTAGHMYRVAQSAFELGSALKLGPEDLRVLAQGGIVHDVGKLQVPDEILNKPGPLTKDERKAIEYHSIAGYQMGARMGFMAPELAIIRSHHERPDGKGYPDGLTRDQIPLPVRMLSVADVYDALTSARAYRPAWSEADAINYLKENRGTQFDAELVDAWIKMKTSGVPAVQPETPPTPASAPATA